jgi:hypothetical protein
MFFRGMLLTTCCLLLLGLVAPAQAATLTFRDGYTAGVPENDLRHVRVVNGQHTLSATFALRDLRPGHRSKVEVVYSPRGAAYPYVVVLRRTADGARNASLWRSDGAHGLAQRLRCSQLRGGWDLARNRITMRLPQQCFPRNARAARVKAMAGFFTYTGPGDFTASRWVRRA